MKIFKRSKFFVVFLLLCFFEVRVVNALEYQGYIYQGEKIDGIYFYKHRSDTDMIKYDTHNFHEQATIYRRSSDNDYVYCIENWAKLTGASRGDYIEKSIHDLSNVLSRKQLSEIETIGYFGYGYKDDTYDHTDKKWYAITQYLIWQVESPNIETYFVDSITSTKPLKIYEDEIKEIRTLVDKANAFPNFTEKDLNHVIYDNMHLEDDSNSINFPNTTISTGKKSVISINGNTINIKPVENGKLDGVFNVSREGNRFSRSSVIYESDNYQNAISIGDYSIKFKNYTIKDVSSLLHINMHCQKTSSFDKEFEYNYDVCSEEEKVQLISDEDIFNNDHEIIVRKGENITLTDDYYQRLYPGKYQILFQGNHRYLDKINHINLTKKLDSPVFSHIYLDYQDGIIKATKMVETFKFNNNGLLLDYILGTNISFGLYAAEPIKKEIDDHVLFNKDDLIATSLTDGNGKVEFNIDIPYGKYYLKELDSNPKYQDNDTKYYFEFYKEGNENIRTIKLDDIYNYLYKGFINVFVNDEESTSPLGGVNIGIYDENENLIYSAYTDDEGTVKLEVPYGKYHVKQLNALAEYEYSTKAIDCELSSEKEDIKIKNKKIKKSESGGIIIPDIPKDEEIEINPDIPKDDQVIIEDGNINIDSSDGFIIDVPSTLENDYELFFLLVILSIILLYLRYEKKN